MSSHDLEAYSLEGGFDAWNGLASRALVDQGMFLVEGNESVPEVIALAYGLEEGAHRFYGDLSQRVEDREAAELFETLSEVEVRHEDRLWARYQEVAGAEVDRETFARGQVREVLEGGLTAEQVLDRYGPGSWGAEEALELAMALETDALDLYLRLAGKCRDGTSRSLFLEIANQERDHLRRLGGLLGERAAGEGD